MIFFIPCGIELLLQTLTLTILNYRGFIDFEIIDRLITEFKVVAKSEDIAFRIYKKILIVMIESMENISKYAEEFEDFVEEKEEYLPSLEISMNETAVSITTQNPVRNHDIDAIQMRLESINKLSREGLKERYIETMTNGEFTAKGGAGLGFIEMAKTSGNNIRFNFERISELFSIFTFSVTIDT